MPLLQIIKKNFKFLSLTFFVFFISCVVQAQDSKSIILPEPTILPEKIVKTANLLAPKKEEISTPSPDSSSQKPGQVIEENNYKKAIQKSAKISKKNIKKSPKISKKK